MGGEWRVEFASPEGMVQFAMFVAQDGPKLTGRTTNDAGEFPLTGTIDRDQFTIVWSFPDVDKLVEITFSGKVTGDTLSGTARLTGVGEGPLSGRRISE